MAPSPPAMVRVLHSAVLHVLCRTLWNVGLSICYCMSFLQILPANRRYTNQLWCLHGDRCGTRTITHGICRVHSVFVL